MGKGAGGEPTVARKKCHGLAGLFGFEPKLSLRQIRKTPLSRGLSYLAEREGFEPSMGLLTPYSLSRGAPSATRPSLRFVLPPIVAGKFCLVYRAALRALPREGLTARRRRLPFGCFASSSLRSVRTLDGAFNPILP